MSDSSGWEYESGCEDEGCSAHLSPPVPPETLLNIRVEGQGTRDIPEDYVSYRVTTDKFDLVCEIFKGCCCVIAREFSKLGVEHFHVVVVGHHMFELLKKRLVRAKLGVNKYWSKKNHGSDFLKAVSYTVKCGDYYCRKGFSAYVDLSPPWVFGASLPAASVSKDLDKDWMLTYNNLLRVAMNHRNSQKLNTTKLSNVLDHMMKTTRWIPSPMMVKSGLDMWYHNMFEWRCGNQSSSAPDWWSPHFSGFN